MNTFKLTLKRIFESFLWIAFLVLITDFVTKQIVLHTMNVGDKINVLGDFFYFEYNINKGMAFGISFGDNDIANQILFVSISVIGAALLIFFFIRLYKKMNSLTKVALGLMIAGCLGNLIDRAFYSQAYLAQYATGVEHNGVVDFLVINFGIFKIPNFNVADSSLVIGTIMLIVILIIDEIKDSKERKKIELASEGQAKVVSKDEQLMNNKHHKNNNETNSNNNE